MARRIMSPPPSGPLKGPTARPCPTCGAGATEPCRFEDGTDGADDTVHIERIWAGMPAEQRPPGAPGSAYDTGEPGRDAVNFAYSISPEFGEAAMVRLGQLAADKRPRWWQWTTWLAVGIVIRRNRERQRT